MAAAAALSTCVSKLLWLLAKAARKLPRDPKTGLTEGLLARLCGDVGIFFGKGRRMAIKERSYIEVCVKYRCTHDLPRHLSLPVGTPAKFY